MWLDVLSFGLVELQQTDIDFWAGTVFSGFSDSDTADERDEHR